MMRSLLACAFVLSTLSASLRAQDPGASVPDVKTGGSPKVKVLTHLTMGGFAKASDLEMEQELSRPYVYVSGFTGYNFHIIDVRDPSNAKEIFRWSIENPELHQGNGFMDGKYFKLKGRYYYVQSTQFRQGGPDADLGAIVFDVTGLPDAKLVKEVARIRNPEGPGGFHNMFAYKHSTGRSLLFATVVGQYAAVYDLEKVVSGAAPGTWMIGKVENPTGTSKMMGGGYHDFYVGWDPSTNKDKFYGAGYNGYTVFDVTQPESPQLEFTITGNGIAVAHTFTPTPDAKFGVTETEYEATPLRIWDLQPGQTGKVENISQPIGLWTPDWQNVVHNHEVRWPYVFVSGYEDGLQIFNMINPAKPKTVGWYYTCECEHKTGFGGGPPNYRGTSLFNGAFGIDVRNADGLIAISDMETGFWLFKMDGFTGWNGNDWGMPNISSVQDWDNGPIRQSGTKPRPAT